MNTPHRATLGIVTGGTFNKGLTVRLDEATNVEALRIGDFCVVEGDDYLYFAMIQDLALQSTDAGLMSAPPDLSPFMRSILRGTATYATAEVQPMLMVPKAAGADRHAQPVRTIPMHFAGLVQADAADIATVFGQDDGQGGHFWIGQPLTMELPIPLNLARLVERSSGIFGSTGTGKSFLTRILLSGIIARTDAVTLTFDMHNEYAFGKESEEREPSRGLKQLFPTRVIAYSLDRNERRATHHLTIGLDEITSEDILSLARELRLSADTVHANLDLLERHLGRQWLRAFTDLEPAALDAFATERGGHSGSLRALQQRLARLRRKEYISEHVNARVFDEMVAYLAKGKHVILHFGRHDEQLDQIIVANMVTRRIREVYQAQTEKFQQSGKDADRPRPLVIVVEEAHRFLNPELARQTIFGTIARELRKYFVTLLIVDQRPSGIDDEILSQVGTRVSGKLMDERDIEAVLSGVANRAAIRAGLASLDTKQQVMIFGHAVPMPIALRTRRYDAAFYQDVTRAPARPTTLDPFALAESPPQPATFEDEVDMLFG